MSNVEFGAVAVVKEHRCNVVAHDRMPKGQVSPDVGVCELEDGRKFMFVDANDGRGETYFTAQEAKAVAEMMLNDLQFMGPPDASRIAQGERFN